MKRSVSAVLLAVIAGQAAAQSTISLASTMNPNGFISESTIVGGFAQIGLGDGSLGSTGANTGDDDGFYALSDLGNPNPPLIPGADPVDLFPREENFQVGSLDYDDTGFTGSGVETFSVTSLDLSGLWTSDPARTDFVNFDAPSVISDISDYAVGFIFFNIAGSIAFGSVDASDTVTFTNGDLTSIDISVTADFIIDGQATYTGSLDFSGDGISFQIDDTQPSFFGPSTLVFDLDGTVNAVIPAPSTAALAAVGFAAMGRRRRRN